MSDIAAEYANRTEQLYQASLPSDQVEQAAEEREIVKARRCIARGPHVEGPGCGISYRAHIRPTKPTDCTTCGDSGEQIQKVGGVMYKHITPCPDCGREKK